MKVTKRDPEAVPEPEPPRDWLMSVMDTIREFSGKCSSDCDHPKPEMS